MALGIIAGIAVAGGLAWFFTKWYAGRENSRSSNTTPGGTGGYYNAYAENTRGAEPAGSGPDMRSTPYPFGTGMGSQTAVQRQT